MNINHIHLSTEIIELSGNIFRKQILKLGDYIHPNNPAKKLKITKKLIKDIMKNFKAGVLDKVPVPDTHTNSALANTGYVIGLEETSDGLDALIKFEDENVAEKAKKGLLPGTSASFTTNYQKKDTGEVVGAVLLHVALVDNPYLKGMRDFEPVMLGDTKGEHIPYILNDKGEKKLTRKELLAKLKEEFDLDVVALQDQVKELSEASEQQTKVIEGVSELFKEVNLSDTTLADVVKGVIDEKEQKEKEVVKLNDEVKGLKESITKQEAKNAVEKLVGEGKITAKEVETYETFYLRDKEMFDQVTSTLKAVVELGEKGFNNPVEPGADGFDAEAEIERLTKDLGL